MTDADREQILEEQIAQWRGYLHRRQAIHSTDVAELEDHLRAQVDGLREAGLAPDEAFLVAVKRMGDLDALSREFAREHSDRLWKQLVTDRSAGDADPTARREGLRALGFAVAAGALVKVAILLKASDAFYLRNAAFFVLPVLAGYFVAKRALAARTVALLAAGLAAVVLTMNLTPFTPGGSTEGLAALHVPVLLWFGVGIAYAGGRWGTVAGRMDFIRFSGELLIYFALIALGGGVVTAFMAMIFEVIGVDLEPFMEQWFPCLVAGAVVIAAWLVEAKQSVVENMAPVLTRLFTPIVTLVLLAFLGTLVVTGRGISFEREALLAFDALLLLVLALVLYALSARDAAAPPGPFDVLQLVLLGAALLADAYALAVIGARITEMGFTPNRMAVLGINLLLLVNLAWSAVLHARFLRGRVAFGALERWQTGYLPAYAAWAAVVVLAFPVLFGFI